MAGTEGDWRASLTPFLFGVAGHVPTRVPCATLLLFGSPAIILGVDILIIVDRIGQALQ